MQNFAARSCHRRRDAWLLEGQLRQRTTDLTEVLEQQTAHVCMTWRLPPVHLSHPQPVLRRRSTTPTSTLPSLAGHAMCFYEKILGGFGHVVLDGKRLRPTPSFAEGSEDCCCTETGSRLWTLIYLKMKQVVHIAENSSEPPQARGGSGQTRSAPARHASFQCSKNRKLVGSLGHLPPGKCEALH